jgi:hypothetical protein
LNVVTRATITAGGSAGKRDEFVKKLSDQKSRIFYQYQRLAEVLLGNDAVPDVQEASFNAL